MSWLGRVASFVFPWPDRRERRARVEHARDRAEAAQAETAASEQKTADSRSLISELHALRRRNHVTEMLEQVIGGQQTSHRSEGEKQV